MAARTIALNTDWAISGTSFFSTSYNRDSGIIGFRVKVQFHITRLGVQLLLVPLSHHHLRNSYSFTYETI